MHAQCPQRAEGGISPLQLQLWTAGSLHVGAGDPLWVLWRARALNHGVIFPSSHPTVFHTTPLSIRSSSRQAHFPFLLTFSSVLTQFSGKPDSISNMTHTQSYLPALTLADTKPAASQRYPLVSFPSSSSSRGLLKCPLRTLLDCSHKDCSSTSAHSFCTLPLPPDTCHSAHAPALQQHLSADSRGCAHLSGCQSPNGTFTDTQILSSTAYLHKLFRRPQVQLPALSPPNFNICF